MPPDLMASANLLRRAATALLESDCFTANDTLCSEDAWEIMMVLTFASLMAPKMEAAVPGTPIIPAPSTLMSATFGIVANPFTPNSPLNASAS